MRIFIQEMYCQNEKIYKTFCSFKTEEELLSLLPPNSTRVFNTKFKNNGDFYIV